MTNARRYWLNAAAALFAGLLLRLWLIHLFARVDGDSLIYGGIAKTLIQHGIYGFTDIGPKGSIDLRPTLIRLPGYPLFLAACFRIFGMEHYRAVMNLQVVLDLCTCWLASALSGRLFGPRSAIAVIWLAALCPFPACYVALPLTETPVIAVITLAFYAFVRWQQSGFGYTRWLWITASSVAASILLRPEQVLFAAAMLPALAWQTKSASPLRVFNPRPALVAMLCVLLPLVPWTFRNWHTFHVLQPLAPKYANDPGEMAPLGFSRWYRTWAIDFCSTEDVYWNFNGERIELQNLPTRAFTADSPGASQALYQQTAALITDYNVTKILTSTLDARFSDLAGQRTRAHPIQSYIVLPFARLLDMIFRPRVEMMNMPLEWWKWSEHRAQTALAASLALLNLAYIGLGFAGFCAWRRRHWQCGTSDSIGPLAYAMAASILLRCLLLLTIDNSETRYTLEFFPVLFVWAGALFAASSTRTAQHPDGR